MPHLRNSRQLSPTFRSISVDTCVRPEDELGTAHFDFKVAHRGGEPCPLCGNPIERITVQNRGTYFCPRCQPFGSGSLI